MDAAANPRPFTHPEARPFRPKRSGVGLAQLSLVEHALCPLDPALSLRPGSIHAVSYHFADSHRHRRTAHASVACPFGLSANDELYLYGLLALHFAQSEPGLDFYATPHYCLRNLGIVEPSAEQGKRYAIFREAVRRLAGVVYQNDNFYDPIRGEAGSFETVAVVSHRSGVDHNWACFSLLADMIDKRTA
jgi:hypothetical protein